MMNITTDQWLTQVSEGGRGNLEHHIVSVVAERVWEMPPRGILLVGSEHFCRSAESTFLMSKWRFRFIHANAVSIELLIYLREPYVAVLNYCDIHGNGGETLDSLLTRFPSMPTVIVSARPVKPVPGMAIIIADLAELQTQLANLSLHDVCTGNTGHCTESTGHTRG